MQKDMQARRTGWLSSLLVLALVGASTELALHGCVFHAFDGHIVYPLLFGAAYGVIAALIASLLPRVAARIAAIVLMLVFTLAAETQLIYHAIFGNFLSLSMVGLGDNVIKSFSAQLFYAMRQNLTSILILLAPLAALVLLCVFRAVFRARARWWQWLLSLAAAVFLCATGMTLMALSSGETVSALQLLRSQNTSTDISYQHLGMTLTTVQELRFMVFGGESGKALLTGELKKNDYDPAEYNIDPELDFITAYSDTEDEELRALDAFFSGRTPTKKNEYTGLLHGCNLITICAESFSPLFIDPELTPALYEMTHRSGFVFENYYGTFQSVTTNGEYTMNTGLLPDMSRTKTDPTFDVAAKNYLPYCLGNALGAQGYETLAYHNYDGHFYNRNITHPNMGYTFRTPDNGLDMQILNPSSDTEMIDASLGDYLHSDKPFQVYYMTYSGHYQYNWNNDMSARNRAAVEGRYPSESVQAFVACNLEVEYAMEHLLAALAEAGKLDTTCIVLTNDHYPYGLSEAEYNELAGHPVDTVFERYRNAFICYAPGLGRTIHVDDYCSTADILPTLLNFFGVTYDSRLLAGTDVLSDAEHFAMLSDESFLTPELRFNAATGVVSANGSGKQPERNDAERIHKEIHNRFIFSSEILNHDYYRHVFRQDADGAGDTQRTTFSDITGDDVYYEAAILYMFEHGYVTPLAGSRFGVSEPDSVANFVHVLYRMAGEPEADPSALPNGYGGEGFSADNPHYAALCWAFEAGVLRDEAGTAPGDPLTYPICAVLLYRCADAAGVIDETEQDALAAFRRTFPDVPAETVLAEAWAFRAGIIRPVNSAEELIALGADEALLRGRTTTYLFRLCTLLENAGASLA